MQKISISLENSQQKTQGNLQTMFDKKLNYSEIPRITMSTTDIKYIEYLIEKGDLTKAKSVLTNLKSIAKNINLQIMEVEEYLISCEGVK